MSKKLPCCLLISSLCLTEGYADCWDDAAKRYNLPVQLLKAIAYVESAYDSKAHETLDDSESIGIMQINSFWYPTLATYGITREHLWDPCTNIQIGAWILAQEVQRTGFNWLAIGSYNVGAYTKNKQDKLHLYVRYANKVYTHLAGKQVQNGE